MLEAGGSRWRRLARRILFAVRPLVRYLPLAVVWVLLWGPVAVATALELARLITTSSEALPRPLRRPFKVWVDRTRRNVALVLRLWPDALSRPGWKGMFRIEGDADAVAALSTRGRSVVLVAIHIGELELLLYWLRSRGIPVAAVAGDKYDCRPPHRRYLDDACDRAGGLVDVPRIFRRDQMLGAVRFLRGGGGVIITASTQLPKQVVADDGELQLRLTPGALHLAALADAVAIPAVMTIECWGRMTLRLGQPWTGKRPDAGEEERVFRAWTRFFLPLVRALSRTGVRRPGTCPWCGFGRRNRSRAEGRNG